MNTKKIEKWLLLEQTGELSPGQRRRLDRALDESDAAGRLRDDLVVFSQSVKKSDVELSPWMVTRIHARLRDEPRSGVSRARLWKSVLALAACLTLVAGLMNFHGAQTSSAPAVTAVTTSGVDVWNVPYEEDLSNLESLIVALSNDSFDIMEM
jgi:ferric-dicitrate binding protein FerR (iron transport regulator)